jgi:hypothetical protein
VGKLTKPELPQTAVPTFLDRHGGSLLEIPVTYKEATMAKFHLNAKGEAGACKATKGGCPFGDDSQHFDSAEAAREHFEQSSSSETFGGVTRKSSDTIDPEVKASIAEELVFENYATLGTTENLTRLTSSQWTELAKEQSVKAATLQAEKNDWADANGYTNGRASDAHSLSGGKTLEDLRSELAKKSDALATKRGKYEMNDWAATRDKLERLEAAVKPGEEAEYSAKFAELSKRYVELRTKADTASRKTEFFERAAELTDTTRVTPDGTKLLVGYSVQPGVYTVDGELLGAQGNAAFPPKYTDSNGKKYTIRPSTVQDEKEAEKRNADKGFVLRPMAGPAKITAPHGYPIITQATQTAATRSKLIGLKAWTWADTGYRGSSNYKGPTN